MVNQINKNNNKLINSGGVHYKVSSVERGQGINIILAL